MSGPGDRKKLGYWNLEQIRAAEGQAELIRQKINSLLTDLRDVEPRLRQKIKLKLLEIDQAAADIYIAMDKVMVEKPPDEAEEEQAVSHLRQIK